MSARPAISVLLPAFNAEQTLGACLASVRRQSEPRWECLLVDDGSADGTRARAEAFAASDARIRVLATPHRGLVAALNTGLAHCRGRVVARMDADDVMHRHRLAAELALLDGEPGLDAVGCHVRLFPRRDLSEGRRAYERWLNTIDSAARVRAEAFVECPIAHPTLMVRTSVLQALGYRDIGWPEDYDLVLRLLAGGHRLGVVPRRLLCWRDGSGRVSRTHATYELERFTACKANFLAQQLLAGTDRYVLWGYGPTARSLRRALLAHGKHPSHIVEVHPGRLGKVIHGAAVISMEEMRRRPLRPLIVSVAGVGPRQEIRDFLAAIGLREATDFVCAA